MSTKELMIEAVRQMPDEATWEEILRQLSSVREEGRAELKSLLREGLRGTPIKLTDAYWDEMRRRYDEELPPVAHP